LRRHLQIHSGHKEENRTSSNGETTAVTNPPVTSSGETKYQCEICGKILKCKYSLRKHMTIHKDEEGIRKHVCDVCGKPFISSSRLIEHKRIHLPEDDPLRKKEKVECDICGKPIAGNGDDDPDKRPFECEICRKSFVLIQHLKRHKEKHLDDNDPKQAKIKRPFKCELCGDTFRAGQNLKLHHANVHSSLSKPINDIGSGYKEQKTFECKICEKTFTHKSGIIYHKRTHASSEEVRKPCKCNTCGMRFACSKSIRNHPGKCPGSVVSKEVKSCFRSMKKEETDNFEQDNEREAWPYEGESVN
ncbi:hypothetical protein PENTCL1PPCAC_26066, partial [Pristionchus entomophagus]